MTPPRPIEFVHLLVTAQCRNRCAFCFNSGNVPAAGAELATEGWISILNQVAELPALRYVFLLEREPLERPDLVRLLDVLRRRRAQIFLCSGGSDLFTEETACDLSTRVDGFIASFHGNVGVLNDVTYDRQRQMLARLGRHFVGKPVNLDINTTVTRLHKGRLMSIVQESARLLGRHPVVESSGRQKVVRYAGPGGTTEPQRIRHNFVRPCLEGGMLREQEKLFWTQAEREWFGEEADFLRWGENCYADVDRPLESFSTSVNGRPCGFSYDSQGAAGFNRLTIRWDGKIIPCASNPGFVMGDAASQALEEIWKQAYHLWRVPDVINAYTLFHAFPGGHCIYHQDAAFRPGALDEEILAQCRKIAERNAS
jgi:MoaA/NifB/PqqE/SkfB family radical SAM enzyme